MRAECRISHKGISPVIDLGNLYVSNFLPAVDEKAPKGPLSLGVGEESGLLQLFDAVDPDILYRQYWYRSGTNQTMRRQLKEIVDVVPRWVKLEDYDIVLDIGCNDGTFLSLYPPECKVLKVGIDPAQNIARDGRLHSNLHAATYFTKETFFSLTDGQQARVITSIAMFYDLEDPDRFVEDIRESLKDNGIWILQISYTPLMMQQNAFDNICHEHIEYYTMTSLDYLLKKHDLKVIDVTLNDTNSGSFCVIITKQQNDMKNVDIFYKDIGAFRYNSISEYEKKLQLNEAQGYLDFMGRVETLRGKTVDLLNRLAREGKTVYGYGASTKGNTLLQYYGLDRTRIRAIAERQPQKFGLLTVGSWIPIVSEEEMRAAKPDYLLILPWHFINEFSIRERDLLRAGCKFILPLPELKVIGE
jgi:2-polyprenyl-3-methyl-5-hydroxy-6-metoxy-1,4-benzoquinol methylase